MVIWRSLSTGRAAEKIAEGAVAYAEAAEARHAKANREKGRDFFGDAKTTLGWYGAAGETPRGSEQRHLEGRRRSLDEAREGLGSERRAAVAKAAEEEEEEEVQSPAPAAVAAQLLELGGRFPAAGVASFAAALEKDDATTKRIAEALNASLPNAYAVLQNASRDEMDAAATILQNAPWVWTGAGFAASADVAAFENRLQRGDARGVDGPRREQRVHAAAAALSNDRRDPFRVPLAPRLERLVPGGRLHRPQHG